MNQQQRETIDRISSVAQRKIWVTFQKEGVHCYPAAATDPALATGDEYDVSFLGPLVENHKLFPNRMNLEIAQLIEPNVIKVNVWERGCGPTLACGTGACAVFALAKRDSIPCPAKVHIR